MISGRTSLLTVLVIWGASASRADNCEPLDAAAPAHALLLEAVGADVHLPPAEILVCPGEAQRWLARWDVFELHEGWRKYATAHCIEGPPLSCRLQRHVAVAGSHEVIDLPYDIGVSKVIEIYRAARAQRPDEEVAAIEHTVVEDGGAWSEEAYGYRIRFIEPPDYSGGEVVTLMWACDEQSCDWRPSPAGHWTPTTTSWCAPPKSCSRTPRLVSPTAEP